MPNLPRCAVSVCTQLLAAVQLHSLERSQIKRVRKWRRVPTRVRAALNKCLETASRFRSDPAAVHLKLQRRNEYCLLLLALLTAKATFCISHCLFSLIIIYMVSVDKYNHSNRSGVAQTESETFGLGSIWNGKKQTRLLDLGNAGRLLSRTRPVSHIWSSSKNSTSSSCSGLDVLSMRERVEGYIAFP